MPAVLTHKTVMLLARKRLQEIEEALRAKRLAAAVPLTNIEERVASLAKKAFDFMSSDPPPKLEFPGVPFSRPLGSGVSRFAVMGSMGPDIPAFSAALQPGQAWVFDNIHKGYPEEGREAVVAGTCDFIFSFWRQVSKAILSEVPSVNQAHVLSLMRAYVMGHLCHMAADILSHPFINTLEWKTSTAAQSKLGHADGEASHDALVARKVLLRNNTRAGEEWDAWWPTADEVPEQFYTAYSAAMDETYDAIKNRRTGLKEFELKLAPVGPPAPVAAFFKDGYHLYRHAIISVVYHNTQFNWLVLLSGILGPFAAAPILGAILPATRGWFWDRQDGRDFSALATLGFAIGSGVALGYSIYAAHLSRRGVELQVINGIAGNVFSTAFGLTAIVLLTQKDVENTGHLVLMLPSLITVFVQLVAFLVYRRNSLSFRRSKLAQAMGLLLLGPALVTLLAAAFFHGMRFLLGLLGSDDKTTFFIATAGWVIGWLVGGLYLARFVRDSKIPEKPKDATEKPQFVRLFDDTTLYRDTFDPRLKGASGLGNLFFPTGRRDLIKIWWTGPGPLFIRPDRFQLVFNFEERSTATDQIVPAPIAPMTLLDFIEELNRLVKGPGGETGKLFASNANPGDPTYDLPPGATFADHGEAEATEEKHKEEAAKFRRIGTTEDTAYVLQHAPKPAQSVHFSSEGPVNADGQKAEDLDKTAEKTGYPYVFDPLSPNDQSVMGYAADVAALLCMGAVTHLEEPVPGAKDERVFQVFRNWSLDRRRVNEWRMLVAGGAVSEKEGQSRKWDPAMLKPPDFLNFVTQLPANVAKQAEQTTLSMGWVPLLRAFLDMASQPNASGLSPDRLRPEYPANIDLSRGMAFLLDSPEPK